MSRARRAIAADTFSSSRKASEQSEVHHFVDDEERPSFHDADSLYNKLEHVVLPLYSRNRDGWVNIMRHAIALDGSFFNTQTDAAPIRHESLFRMNPAPTRPAGKLLLTVNGGSSSIKFALFEASKSLERILSGKIERIGLRDSVFVVKALNADESFSRSINAPDHTAAVAVLMDWMEERFGRSGLAAVGHRAGAWRIEVLGSAAHHAGND